MNPVLLAWAGSTAAALGAAVGSLPLLFSLRVPGVVLGWANALAAGLMLGAAYLLLAAGANHSALAGAVASLAAVALLHSIDRRSRSAFFVHSLHSGPEGLAIGAAVVSNTPLGILVIVAIAIHNVPEAVVLGADLQERGVSFPKAAALAVSSNAGQIAVATLSAALAWLFAPLLPWILGLAVGSLAYLVMIDLLPRSYERAGNTSIALVTLGAMAILVLLGTQG